MPFIPTIGPEYLMNGCIKYVVKKSQPKKTIPSIIRKISTARSSPFFKFFPMCIKDYPINVISKLKIIYPYVNSKDISPLEVSVYTNPQNGF